MPINRDSLETIKAKLAAYVKGWTAHAVLKQTINNEEVVTEARYKQLAKEVVEANPKATLNDLIRKIIQDSRNAEAIPWETNDKGDEYKTVVVHVAGQVLNVTVTKQAAPEDVVAAGDAVARQQYTVDINGEVDPKDLQKFHPPGLQGGSTTITFDSVEGYTIDPGNGVPPFNSEVNAHRLLQLNCVRVFAQAVENGNSKQLALLGTGTGKSFIIASAAEAVGSSVSIVPSKVLVNGLWGDGFKSKIYSGKAVACTLELTVDGQKVDVSANARPLELTEDDQKVDDPANPPKAKYGPPYTVLIPNTMSVGAFRELLKRDDVNIILNADHENFSEFTDLIKDKLLLIDESHMHAFSAAQAAKFGELCSNNVSLALTATPTGALNKEFEGSQCVEFNLGNAMDAGMLRPVSGTTIRLSPQEDTLVGKAMTSFFRPVYFKPGDAGYQKLPDPPTIASILRNRLPPCPKALIFSDDATISHAISAELQQIEAGQLDPSQLKKYANKVRADRIQDLRIQMAAANITATDAEIEAAIPPVNLQAEMRSTRKEAIKNTIFSFALSVLFRANERDVLASGLRDGTISKWPVAGNSSFRPLTGEKDLKDRMDIVAASEEMKNLGEDDRANLLSMISDAAVTIDTTIKEGEMPKTLAGVVTHLRADSAIDEKVEAIMQQDPPEVVVVSKLTSEQAANRALARLTVGLEAVGLSDESWSAGVNVKDLFLSMILINKLDFEHPSAVCTPVGATQAGGRAVRAKDGRGQVVMIASDDIPDELILSVEAILSTEYGARSKEVLDLWEVAREAYYSQLAYSDESEYSELQLKEIAYQIACNRVIEYARLVTTPTPEVPTEGAAVTEDRSLAKGAGSQAAERDHVSAQVLATGRVALFPAAKAPSEAAAAQQGAQVTPPAANKPVESDAQKVKSPGTGKPV